ncbi:hypothetical protein [Pseudomonas sp.]|jgi:hypothetical protein|uniref:hypothetical protein n=1 Tax=Pseudomonas sp. TaxID=306 RepID=UPI0028AFE35D|nr:hypothetical protein [Pseudomonas sp.]
MQVRVERVEGTKPSWRLYLNDFYIVCASHDEVLELKYKALAANQSLYSAPAAAVRELEVLS